MTAGSPPGGTVREVDVDADGLALLVARLEEGESLAADEIGTIEGDRYSTGLGLVWDRFGRDRVTAHLEVTERHHQPHGIVHGGVYCAIVESIASMGGAIQAVGQGRVVVGVSNTTDFLRAHRTGRLDAVGEPVHVGRSQQLWQVVITRASDDKQVARGQVRLHNVDPATLG